MHLIGITQRIQAMDQLAAIRARGRMAEACSLKVNKLSAGRAAPAKLPFFRRRRGPVKMDDSMLESALQTRDQPGYLQGDRVKVKV
jgi:hypothetical protein